MQVARFLMKCLAWCAIGFLLFMKIVLCVTLHLFNRNVTNMCIARLNAFGDEAAFALKMFHNQQIVWRGLIVLDCLLAFSIVFLWLMDRKRPNSC